MHEAKASERADSGPPVATPLVFAVLAALFLTYQLIPIERIARLVKGGSGLAESGGGPGAGGAKRFSYPTPPAFPSTRTTDYIYFFHCLRWNNVVVCDSCRRVVPPPCCEWRARALYKANNGRRCERTHGTTERRSSGVC